MSPLSLSSGRLAGTRVLYLKGEATGGAGDAELASAAEEEHGRIRKVILDLVSWEVTEGWLFSLCCLRALLCQELSCWGHPGHTARSNALQGSFPPFLSPSSQNVWFGKAIVQSRFLWESAVTYLNLISAGDWALPRAGVSSAWEKRGSKALPMHCLDMPFMNISPLVFHRYFRFISLKWLWPFPCSLGSWSLFFSL